MMFEKHSDSNLHGQPAAHEWEGRRVFQEAVRAQAVAPSLVLLNEDEAAAALGISKRTFLNLRTEKWMPAAISLGPRLRRYALDELRAAVAVMPREGHRPQPAGLMRAKVENLKAFGVPLDPSAPEHVVSMNATGSQQ